MPKSNYNKTLNKGINIACTSVGLLAIAAGITGLVKNGPTNDTAMNFSLNSFLIIMGFVFLIKPIFDLADYAHENQYKFFSQSRSTNEQTRLLGNQKSVNFDVPTQDQQQAFQP